MEVEGDVRHLHCRSRIRGGDREHRVHVESALLQDVTYGILEGSQRLGRGGQWRGGGVTRAIIQAV